MNIAIKMGRQAFTWSVVGATIAWSIGIATLVQPLTARAVMAGDLVKGSLQAVYYYGSDGKRYVFPNEKTYWTWYADFSGVMTLSDAEIAAMPIGGNVVYRAGTRLVKIQTDPRVYSVEPMGVIRWVESEAVASALYGAGWASRVHDVPDVFFVDYTPGASVADASRYPAGSLVKNTGDADVYYVVDGTSKRWVDPAAMSANNFRSEFVLETSQNLAVYSDGANVTGSEMALHDAAQLGAAGPAAPAGGLTVSLATDTPAGATVPRGVNAVPMLALSLSASGGAATLSSLILKRSGVGATTDITNVYLYLEGSRLTDGRTVNAQSNEVTFSGLNVMVPDGGTTKLWVRADVAAAAGAAGNHGFQIESAAKVSSNAGSVGGSFPVTGNLFSIGAGTVGTLTIDATGTIPNPTLGQQQAEIARFTLATTAEDASITRVNFDLEGSIRNADLTNLSLWQGTTKLAEVASVTGTGLIVLSVNPTYVLPEGATRTFNLKADIGGDANRTIGVRLEEPGDLWATGSDFGFNMAIANAGYNGGDGPNDAARGACDAVTDDCSFSTVQGAQLTYAFNGPAARDISTNSQDQLFMNFSITAQQFTTIREFGVIVTCQLPAGNCDNDANDDGGLLRQNTEQNLKDIKITKADGSLLMGPLELAVAGNDQTQTLTMTEDFTLTAGQTMQLRLTADIDNNAVAVDAFNMTVDVSTILAEDTNGDTITAANIVPSADIAGNNMTLRASALTMTFTTPPSDGLAQRQVRGLTGESSVAYSFAAGNASDMTVTTATLTTSVDGDIATDQGDFVVGTETEADGGATVAARDIVSSASLYDGDTGALIAGPESVRTTPAGTVTFDNFVWTIPKGQTKKLLARANIANYTVVGEDDAYAFRLAAVGDVTVQDSDGNAVTPTLGTNNGTAAAPTVFIRVTNSGTITVTQDAATPRSDVILAGATNVVVAKYRVDAVDEGMLVKRVTINERGATNNGGTAGDNDNNVSSVTLSYPIRDGSTKTAVGFFTAGEALINLPVGQEFFIPANNARTLTVMATLPTIENGATTGEKPRFDFDIDAAADDQFEAVGDSSGVTLDDDNAADAAANAMVVRETQPTISLAAGSPTTGTPGLAEVFRVTVAAAAGEAVVLDMITFKMTSTDNNGDTSDAGLADEWNVCDETADNEAQQQIRRSAFSFFDAAAPTTALEAGDADWVLLALDGSTCTDDAERMGFARLNLTTPELVAAGATKTYQLKVDTTGAAAANDDSVRFEIVNEPIVAAFLATAGGSDPDEVEGAVTAVATNFAVDDAGDAALLDTDIAAGDLICFDEDNQNDCDAGEEIALVTAVNNVGATTASLDVYRGDLGRAQQAIDDNANLVRMPASLVWDDDGSTTAINEVSGFLVDNLDVTSATIVY